jgi:hypothetical protein
MSLRVERVRIGFVRIVLGGDIGAAQMAAVRRQLAELLAERPTAVEVHLCSVPSDALGRGLLRSFSDILWARGCWVVLTEADV